MTIADDRNSKAKRKREAAKEFRRAVLARAKVPGGWKCERCDMPCRHEGSMHAHHRLPRSQGGSNFAGNGAALCWTCHDDVHNGRGDWDKWLIVRNTFRVQKETG